MATYSSILARKITWREKPGGLQSIGVKTRLDNGVTGFIPTKFLSDKVVKRPEERVKVGE